MHDPKRILIIGGAGFIGAPTARLLLEQGQQVVVLDNLSSGQLENLPLKHPNFEFVEGDVLEYPLVVDLLNGCDAVLHLAAISSVPQSIENPIYSFQVNTQGFLHVLCAINQAKRPIRFVFASSAASYGGGGELPCRDDLPLIGAPLSPYALQKIHNEMYAELYARVYNTPSLALRYFNVYGKGQDPYSPYSGVMSRFLEAYQNDQELIIFGDGMQSRDFIYVEEVALANCLALQSTVTGILNIATGEAKTLLQLLEYIETIGGKPAKLRFEPKRLGDIQSSYAAVFKAKEQLGFQSSLSLQEGIKKMLEKA